MLDLLARKIAARLEIKPEDVAKRVATAEFAQTVANAIAPSPSHCPVCVGKGAVRQGFYHSEPEPRYSTFVTVVRFEDGWEECRACHGKGMVR